MTEWQKFESMRYGVERRSTIRQNQTKGNNSDKIDQTRGAINPPKLTKLSLNFETDHFVNVW